MVLQQVNTLSDCVHVYIIILIGVTGHYYYCSIISCTTGDNVTDMNWLWSVVSAVTNLICLVISLVFLHLLLLLLSGDVELNPGPITGKQ